MVDFTELDITHVDKELLMKNPLLQFSHRVFKDTGEVRLPYKSSYGCMEILVCRSCIKLKGSLHKFHNERTYKSPHNYDDFTLSKLVSTVQMLEEELGIQPERTSIVNLEFGANILVDSCPKDIIEMNIHGYNKTIKEYKTEEYVCDGIFKMFKLGEFNIKTYNKSAQPGSPEKTLRFEVKTRKSRYLNNMGIITLQDLLSPEKLGILKDDLLMRLGQMVILDSHQYEGTPEFWRLKKRSVSKSKYLRDWNAFMAKLECEGQLSLKRSLICRLASIWEILQAS